MKDYLAILQTLATIAAGPGTKLDEGWGYTHFSEVSDPGFIANYNSLKNQLGALGLADSLSVRLGNTRIEDTDLQYYLDQKVTDLRVYLNKEPLFALLTEGFHFNLFLSVQNCLKWLDGLDPLNALSPLSKQDTITILVYDLKEPFGGPFIRFLSGTVQLDWTPVEKDSALPEWAAVKENVHLVGDDLKLNYNLFWVTGGNASALRDVFLRKTLKPFAVAVADEYLADGRIVLDGVRRMTLNIGPVTNMVTWPFYNYLVELVSWLYGERVQVKKKLFAERLSLDLDEQKSLTDALVAFGEKALTQAQARYNFVIIDRKDAYVKELRELLKDIRTQSDLLAGKIRALLSNFLRDMLAAIVLIGFTIFTKFDNLNTLEANKLMIEFVFNTLAIYYLAAVVLQFIIDLTDVSISKKELLYWNKASKELLPEKEFTQHIDASLRLRRYSQFLYLLIAAGYIGIAYICHIYPELFETFFKHNPVVLHH